MQASPLLLLCRLASPSDGSLPDGICCKHLQLQTCSALKDMSLYTCDVCLTCSMLGRSAMGAHHPRVTGGSPLEMCPTTRTPLSCSQVAACRLISLKTLKTQKQRGRRHAGGSAKPSGALDADSGNQTCQHPGDAACNLQGIEQHCQVEPCTPHLKPKCPHQHDAHHGDGQRPQRPQKLKPPAAQMSVLECTWQGPRNCNTRHLPKCTADKQ